jgi:hypothetical protein
VDTGTLVTALTVSKQSYTSIQLNLDDSCTSGHSWDYSNGKGKHLVTTDQITLQFDGSFVVIDNNQSITLDLQTILSTLTNVTNGNGVKNAVEHAHGQGHSDNP